MRCIHASKMGDIHDVLSMSEDIPLPTLDPKGGQMLVRVEACTLNPLDCHMLLGSCSRVLKPPAYPFVPGTAVSGVVEEIAEGGKFKKGDRVVASNEIPPIGGLAEFIAVETKNAALAPENLDAVGAATLPISSMTAMLVMRKVEVKPGERVLVLGGSGGVGTAIVQLTKDAEASFVAVTSTQESLMQSLGADMIIDYRETKWWEIKEFQDKPFDVVIDCVGWRDEWAEASRCGAIKAGREGGRYMTLAVNDNPKFTTVWEGVRMIMPPIWRMMWTSVRTWKPRYRVFVPNILPDDWVELVKLVEEKRLKPVLDPASPFPFTTDGVKRAFELQSSKHAHGKVVVTMSA